MENKKLSFYELLAANSTIKETEGKKIHPIFILISWIIIFMINVTIIWLAWNFVGSPLMNLKHATFMQCILIYAGAKVLTRGFFST